LTERGGWSRQGGLPVRMLGTRFDVRYPSAEVGDELRRVLGPFLVPPHPSTADAPAVRTIAVPARAGPAPAVSQVVGQLLGRLNLAALQAADCLAVHSGAVALGGRVVAFPGPSGVGKSTLTACCLQAGLEYVSDEALCLSWDTGAVLGYPRAMALSRWSAGALGVRLPSTVDELLLTAADLGATVAPGPLAVAHVVLVDRMGGQAACVLQPTSRGDAVAELLRRSFTHWRDPDRAFALAHETMRRAQAWRLTLGDPGSAAGLIGRLLSSDPDRTGPASNGPASNGPANTGPASADPEGTDPDPGGRSTGAAQRTVRGAGDQPGWPQTASR
jgi:hypothetical protein